MQVQLGLGRRIIPQPTPKAGPPVRRQLVLLPGQHLRLVQPLQRRFHQPFKFVRRRFGGGGRRRPVREIGLRFGKIDGKVGLLSEDRDAVAVGLRRGRPGIFRLGPGRAAFRRSRLRRRGFLLEKCLEIGVVREDRHPVPVHHLFPGGLGGFGCPRAVLPPGRGSGRILGRFLGRWFCGFPVGAGGTRLFGGPCGFRRRGFRSGGRLRGRARFCAKGLGLARRCVRWGGRWLGTLLRRGLFFLFPLARRGRRSFGLFLPSPHFPGPVLGSLARRRFRRFGGFGGLFRSPARSRLGIPRPRRFSGGFGAGGFRLGFFRGAVRRGWLDLGRFLFAGGRSRLRGLRFLLPNRLGRFSGPRSVRSARRFQGFSGTRIRRRGARRKGFFPAFSGFWPGLAAGFLRRGFRPFLAPPFPVGLAGSVIGLFRNGGTGLPGRLGVRSRAGIPGRASGAAGLLRFWTGFSFLPGRRCFLSAGEPAN